jgi:hypothetical protein
MPRLENQSKRAKGFFKEKGFFGYCKQYSDLKQ